jgi:hypothetical protein
MPAMQVLAANEADGIVARQKNLVVISASTA